MGLVTKIAPDFTIDIPEELRKQPGWMAGEKLAFVPQGDSFVLVPVPSLESLRGIARGANTEGYRDRNDRY